VSAESVDICPGLYRDPRKPGAFYCEFARRAVDPGLMPCLADYEECPIYKEWKKREEKERIEKEAVEVPPQVEIEEKKEEIRPKLQPRKRPEDTLMEDLNRLEEHVIELNTLWERYEREALKAIETWEDLKAEAERLLAGLASSLSVCKAELDNIETKFRLGLLDEDSYIELRDSLEEKMADYEEIVAKLESAVSRVERLIAPHFKRIMASRAKPEVEKLKVSLMKLQKLYEEGRISKETYDRLRRELQAKIAKLEEIVVESSE